MPSSCYQVGCSSRAKRLEVIEKSSALQTPLDGGCCADQCIFYAGVYIILMLRLLPHCLRSCGGQSYIDLIWAFTMALPHTGTAEAGDSKTTSTFVRLSDSCGLSANSTRSIGGLMKEARGFSLPHAESDGQLDEDAVNDSNRVFVVHSKQRNRRPKYCFL